jgi:hypothetical protein
MAPRFWGEVGYEEYPFDLICPESHPVAVGFGGQVIAPGGTILVHALELRCAELRLEGDDAAGYSLTVGATVDIGPIGGNTGYPFPVVTCEPGAVAVGTSLRTGDHIDGIGMYCGGISLHDVGG